MAGVMACSTGSALPADAGVVAPCGMENPCNLEASGFGPENVGLIFPMK